MEVVAHDDEGMKKPVPFLCGFDETIFESRLGPIRLENVGPVIASVDHMVDGTGEFQAKLSGHPDILATGQGACCHRDSARIRQ